MHNRPDARLPLAGPHVRRGLASGALEFGVWLADGAARWRTGPVPLSPTARGELPVTPDVGWRGAIGPGPARPGLSLVPRTCVRGPIPRKTWKPARGGRALGIGSWVPVRPVPNKRAGIMLEAPRRSESARRNKR